MLNNEIKIEDEIFQAAHNIFLLYGYHGTTLQQIANLAGTQKSSIHYYFRSKEKLYVNVVKHVLENILKTDIHLIPNRRINRKQRWFLFTELYNNQGLFEKTLKELYLNNWGKKLNDIRELLEIKGSI